MFKALPLCLEFFLICLYEERGLMPWWGILRVGWLGFEIACIFSASLLGYSDHQSLAWKL